MGKDTGFLEHEKQNQPRRPVEERVGDYKEYDLHYPESDLKVQASRCMDCGIPFCHTGCPLGNLIPDWNDLVYRGAWKDALNQLPQESPAEPFSPEFFSLASISSRSSAGRVRSRTRSGGRRS